MIRIHAYATSSLVAGLLLLSGPAGADMFEYTDSQGRLHFTQDIEQVPPEYRDQVEKKTLRKQISVTGEGGPAKASTEDRIEAMKKRQKRLQQSMKNQQRQHSRPASGRHISNVRRVGSPLAGAPEPRKYDRECEYDSGTGEKRCRRILRPDWQAWNRANGGNNGKPDIRRRVGDP